MRKFTIQIFAVVFLFAGSQLANAAKVTIVAFGASHTYSKGVPRGSDYPAQMQRILRARGIMARVINAGRNGNTTGQMLARLGASVPGGTKIVIFQPGGNDRRKGVSSARRKSNIRAIKQRLKARGIKVIMMRNRIFGILRKNGSYIGRDGQHLSVAGYRELARRFANKVVRVLGR